MRKFLTISGFSLLLYMEIASAQACSMSEGFVRPSNFELIQMTDAIVIASAISASKNKNSGSTVRFKVIEDVKGDTGKTVYDNWGHLGETVQSDPMELAAAHPDAYAGPCNRMTYAKGHEYVLFLQRQEDGKYLVSGSAFSRINEDYFGPDSLWMKIINYYLDVQESFEPMEQLYVLRSRFEELISDERSISEEKLAIDILNHLMSRSPYKPTEYLVQTYLALEEGRELPFAVRSPEADKEGSDAEKLTELVFGPRYDSTFDIEEQKHFILWSLVNGDHPDALSLFERLVTGPVVNGAIIGASARFLSKHGQYRRAINLANAHAFRVMNSGSRRETRHFLRGALRLRFDENSLWAERWQSDSYAQKWWPEFAMAVDASQRARFGEDAGYSFGGAAAALRPKDYRDRPDVARMLADTYDKDVVNWAESEVQAYIDSDEELDSDLLDLPVEILLLKYRSSIPKSVERIEKFFCADKQVRYTIISRVGLIQNYNTEDLLFRIARYEGLSGHEPMYVTQTIAMFLGGSTREFLLGNGWGFSEAEDLLKAFIKDEPIEIDERDEKDRRPIVCG